MEMDYSLKHLKGRSYYIPGRVNLGLYSTEEGSLLIDSGGDESSGRAIYRMLQREGLSLKTIINTHSNADHVGGNAYLQKKTGCRIHCTAIESIITENPFLEPVLLWSAYPFKELENKFLQAKPSKVTEIIPNSGDLGETGLEVVSLPGHFLDMIGIRTPDGVFYIADSLFSGDIIDKYHLIVNLDVRSSLKTMDLLEASRDRYYVPCHAEMTENIVPLVRKNRENLVKVGNEIVDICSEPSSREDILARIMQKYGLELSPTQYVLNLATISAHVSYLSDENRLEYAISEGRLLWKKK